MSCQNQKRHDWYDIAWLLCVIVMTVAIVGLVYHTAHPKYEYIDSGCSCEKCQAVDEPVVEEPVVEEPVVEEPVVEEHGQQAPEPKKPETKKVKPCYEFTTGQGVTYRWNGQCWEPQIGRLP